MFKKYLLTVAFVCGFVWVFAGLAQITAPTPTTFKVTPKRFAIRNITGAPLKSVVLRGIPDTLQPVICAGVVIDTFYRDSYYNSIIKFDLHLEAPSNVIAGYTDTLRHGVQYYFPESGSTAIADSVFLVVLDTATAVGPGDKFEISVRSAPWKDIAYDDILYGDTVSVKKLEPRLFQGWK